MPNGETRKRLPGLKTWLTFHLIISGSLPAKADPGIYKKIIEILKADKIKTFLDTSGRALYYGMLALPDIVKINNSIDLLI